MTNKEARIAAAKEMERNGDWDAATIVWQEIGFEFRDPDLVSAAAVAAWEAGLIERAEELFLEALKIQPTSPNGLFGLGMLLEESDRLLERARNADPTDPRPRAALDEIDRDSSERLSPWLK